MSPESLEVVLEKGQDLDILNGYFSFLYLNFDINPIFETFTNKPTLAKFLLDFGHFPFANKPGPTRLTSPAVQRDTQTTQTTQTGFHVETQVSVTVHCGSPVKKIKLLKV